jgi:hypothetical protein
MNGRTIVSGLFFSLFLLTGLLCFKDYGINWDEPVHRWRGHAFLNYLFQGDRQLIESEIQRSYGTFPDIILAAVERAVGYPRETRAPFLARRLVLFLIFFIGVVFFFLLGEKLFRDWRLGLLGSLFLILSPRIFAHSFHNAKDIPLLVAMIVAFYTLVRYLEKPSGGRLAVHALACAVATDVRITGVLSFCLTGSAFLCLLWDRRKNIAAMAGTLKQAAIFGLLYVAFTILLWPTLWEKPFQRFIEVILFSTNLPWGGKLLYLGRFYRDGELPWHYIPVWIAVSTPLLYLVLFLLGFCALIFDFIRRPAADLWRRLAEYQILLWFFVPPFLTILFKVHTFDEWRHLFYIYPAILLIALRGLSRAFEAAKKTSGQVPAGRLVSALIMLGVMGGLLPIANFMLHNHPHENVYFNRLAGRDMAEIGQKFELDYWGNSYKQGLEYILASDPSPVIAVAVQNSPGEFNGMILPPAARRRIIYVRPLRVDLGVNRQIQKFVDLHSGKYATNVETNKLIIRSPMTPGEKERLLKIIRTPEESRRVENAYDDSLKLKTADYFLTNYRLHPDDYPLPKVHSINVGNASILGIYKFPPAAESK